MFRPGAKKLYVMLASAIALFMTASLAFSETDLDYGKKLFNDPSFAGGSKACNECHVGGRGLEGASKKEKFTVMGNNLATLEDVVNFCIKNASKGIPIAKDSREMKAIVEYIKSLSPVNTGVRG